MTLILLILFWSTASMKNLKPLYFMTWPTLGNTCTTSSINPHMYEGNNVRGVSHYRDFNLKINVSKNPEIEGEFKLLGGDGYDFIPYEKRTPVISGVSKYSLYFFLWYLQIPS